MNYSSSCKKILFYVIHRPWLRAHNCLHVMTVSKNLIFIFILNKKDIDFGLLSVLSVKRSTL